MADKLALITQSTGNFLRSLNLPDTYKTIITESKNWFGARSGSVYLSLDGELRRVFTTTPQARRVESRRKGYTQRAFDKKEVIIIYAEEFKSIHPEFRHSGVNFILIPLVFDDKSIGVLSLQSTIKGKFTGEDIQTMKVFGNLAALKVRNALLREDTRKSLETRDTFISLAIHELNTPLTILNGYADLLKRKVKAKNTGMEDKVNAISEQIERMKQIMKSFEKFNQVKGHAAKKQVRKFNLKKAINRAVIDFRTRFPSYKLIIEEEILENTPIVRGDIYKITQVFVNLLENAAKFSKDISPIHIVLRETDQFIVASIEDPGTGMPKKDIKKVFEGSFKAAGNTRHGMGLGLYLSKIIIDAHNGDIKIKSKVGRGTKVEISLPKT